MNIIKIGNIPIKDISQDDILQIIKIEGVHNVFEYNGKKIWDQPLVIDFCNTMFSDTVVIDYQQKRISDGLEGNIIVFFLNHNNFSFHWHFKDEDSSVSKGSRLRIESIKYLIEKGYDVPLY